MIYYNYIQLRFVKDAIPLAPPPLRATDQKVILVVMEVHIFCIHSIDISPLLLDVQAGDVSSERFPELLRLSSLAVSTAVPLLPY
jgi:hypothetical protein